MRKRVIALSLAALAAILVGWWWASPEVAGPGERGSAGAEGSASSSSGGAPSARAPLPLPSRTEAAPEVAGVPAELAAVDDWGNPVLVEVSGAVLDLAAETPVSGAEVIFRARSRRGETSAVTGGDGRYATTLAPGVYEVSAISAGRYPVPGTLRLTRDAPEVTHDVFVVGAATVRGRVVDGRGAPIAGAGVTFRSWFQGEKIKTRHVRDVAPEAATTTGPDGRFELPVVPGMALIEARDGDATASVRIDAAAPGGSYEVRIVLDATATLSGAVVTPAGAPVAGAAVRVAIRNDIHELSLRAAETDEDGKFRIDRVTPGRAEIGAHAAGVGSSPSVSERIASGGAVEVRLVVAEGAAIAGVVVDGGGSPIAGARVRCYGQASKLPPVQVASDGDGAFRCALHPGLYRIEATKQYYGSVTVTDVKAPSDGVRLELRAP